MDFLTREQNERFAEVNARLGLGPDEFTADLPPDELSGLPHTRIMSSTGDSHFPRVVIPVGSIDEMRKLVGLGGNFVAPKVGTEPDYPVAPSQAEIDQILSAVRNNAKPQIGYELKQRIEQAAIAYVLGNPDNVAPFVPLINALLYPGRVAVFTGQKLELPRGASHIITGDDPVVLNYGQISVAQGATIKVKSTTFISSQVFTKEAGVAADQGYTIENIGDPWPDAAQQGGQGGTGPVQTGTGANAVYGYNGNNCQWFCLTEPTNGPQGNAGLKGLPGAPGAPGNPSGGGLHNLGLITNPITMLIGGGDGQQGGKGGTGGAGGAGGLKGAPGTGCKNNATDGPQGPGGQGGDGGPGGPGGVSGYLTVYYSYNGTGPAIQVTVRTVAGGAGGLPGDPGPGVGNNGSGNIGTPPGTQGAIPLYALNKS
jgi:hypothetical protein